MFNSSKEPVIILELEPFKRENELIMTRQNYDQTRHIGVLTLFLYTPTVDLC